MNILIWGLGGKMGKIVKSIVDETEGLTLVGGVDKFADPTQFNVPVFRNAIEINTKVDVLIDFSRPDALTEILSYATSNKVACVLCTTGYSDEQENQIKEVSKIIPIFRSSNMSIGVNLMVELCKKAAQLLGNDFEVEIIEQHHNQKVDAPSGTALTIANAINEEFNNSKTFIYGRSSKNQKRDRNEIGIHAVRGGTIVGKHDALFIGQDEIVTIAHEAQSKAVFAKGAVRAAIFIGQNKEAGLYNMKDLIASV